jgi:hypothetical protein
VPDGIAVAPPLPDVLPPAKLRRGVTGFVRRHLTVALGGTLVLVLIGMALLAPYLATFDPTALAPANFRNVRSWHEAAVLECLLFGSLSGVKRTYPGRPGTDAIDP